MRAYIRRYNPSWGSHMPLIIKVMGISKGDVVELGMGPFSSPLLHMLCLDMDRKLFSYEDNDEYYYMHHDFKTDWHKVVKVDDWNNLDFDRNYGLAFIDQSPSNARRETARKLRHRADYIVIHDTQPKQEYEYRYNEIYPLFKYKYQYTKALPYTTVLSNKYELNYSLLRL